MGEKDTIAEVPVPPADTRIFMVARGPHGSLLHQGAVYHPGQTIDVAADKVAEWKGKGWIRGPQLKAHVIGHVAAPKAELPARGKRYVAEISDEIDGEESSDDSDPDSDPIEVNDNDAADHLVGQEITTAGRGLRRGGRPARKPAEQPLT